jgi:hypothetical protein
MARRQPIGRLRDREVTPRETVMRTIARLHAKGYAAIKKLVTLEPKPELQAWLRVLVKRSAIDYMRESPEYERATAKRDHRWISLASLSSPQGPVAAQPDSLVEGARAGHRVRQGGRRTSRGGEASERRRRCERPARARVKDRADPGASVARAWRAIRHGAQPGPRGLLVSGGRRQAGDVAARGRADRAVSRGAARGARLRC